MASEARLVDLWVRLRRTHLPVWLSGASWLSLMCAFTTSDRQCKLFDEVTLCPQGHGVGEEFLHWL